MAASPDYLASDAGIAPVATLLADSTRAAMLTALLDGRALAAGELARLAGVSAATASSHLARLRSGGLVTVVSQGRHRYYRLAGPEVASALEVLARIGPQTPVRSLRQSRQAAALSAARTCYDHLAGQAGVALLDALLANGVVCGADGAADLDVTEDGDALLAGFGVDTSALRGSRRRFAATCLDWTERRPHLGGALGAAITGRLLELGWVEHGPSRRVILVSAAGTQRLAATFGYGLANHGARLTTGRLTTGRLTTGPG
jgi:DNA-binding transcriptional ArsR family regulator